jgi:uncharacterized protein (TIGR03435 family)
MSRLAIHVLAALLSTVLAAQQETPSFEVASIKPNNSPPFQDSSWGFPPGRLLVRNANMRLVIAMVYGEPRGFPIDRVLGGPSWLDTDRYDIEGKTVEPDPSEARLRAMARSLLERRFALRSHVERRELPIYTLTDDGTGTPRRQLRASDGRDCAGTLTPADNLPRCGPSFLPAASAAGLVFSGYFVTMDEIASVLQPFVNRPLVNRTTIAGRLSFTLTVPRAFEAKAGTAPDPGDSIALISQALQDQLGLRLTSSKGPVDVLVIDSVQRPTPD